MKKRSPYSPQFKARVAFEVLLGERSQMAISWTHTLSGEVVSRWRISPRRSRDLC